MSLSDLRFSKLEDTVQELAQTIDTINEEIHVLRSQLLPQDFQRKEVISLEPTIEHKIEQLN